MERKVKELNEPGGGDELTVNILKGARSVGLQSLQGVANNLNEGRGYQWWWYLMEGWGNSYKQGIIPRTESWWFNNSVMSSNSNEDLQKAIVIKG